MYKCHSCKKKTLIEYKCKCNLNFCSKHAQPYQHKCSFDFCKNNPLILTKIEVNKNYQKI